MQRKVEFCDNFKKQVLKLNQFLQTWAKAMKTMDCDPRNQLVIEFSANKKQVIDYEAEFKDQAGYLEIGYLSKSILGIQKILRKLFFGGQ